MIVAAIKLTTDFTTVAVSTVLIEGFLLTAYVIAVRFIQCIVNRAA